VLAVHLVGPQALQPGALAAATLIEANEPNAAQTPAVAIRRRNSTCSKNPALTASLRLSQRVRHTLRTSGSTDEVGR
jgi:hypothetical protein